MPRSYVRGSIIISSTTINLGQAQPVLVIESQEMNILPFQSILQEKLLKYKVELLIAYLISAAFYACGSRSWYQLPL